MVTHRSGWDSTDQRMLTLAATRSPVLFLDRGDNEYPVTLIAWRGRCGSNKCRIQHPSGRQATVNTALVRPLPTKDTQP